MRHPFRRALWALAALGLASLLAGCVDASNPATPVASAAEHALAVKAVSFADLPGWQQDQVAQALAVFVANCRAMAAVAPDQKLGGQGDAAARGGTVAQWRPACDAAGTVPPGDDAAARGFFEAWFEPNAVSDSGSHAASPATEGLFTGYFEPEVAGSRSPGGVYRTPVLGRPGDLVQVDLGDFIDELKGRAIVGRLQEGRLVPYYDRAEIEGGALSHRHLELLWLADPIDAYFLQVQGSGRVDLPDGKVVRLSYAGQNGRHSVLIGKVLADRGEIPLDQVSMQSIRAWLVAHPAQATEVLDQNPSYVFFREVNNLPPDQGPPGALGVPLTPGRSIAVDRSFLPMGAPVFIATTDPLSKAPLQRLTVAQDVGGAIRGPVRADIFFGWGHDAEDRAGRMREHGTDFVLLPRAAPLATVPSSPTTAPVAPAAPSAAAPTAPVAPPAPSAMPATPAESVPSATPEAPVASTPSAGSREAPAASSPPSKASPSKPSSPKQSSSKASPSKPSSSNASPSKHSSSKASSSKASSSKPPPERPAKPSALPPPPPPPP